MNRARAFAVWLATALPGAGASAAAPLPDPTRPADWDALPVPAAEPVARDWVLRGVRIGEDGRRAIINERSVEVGERIGAATVREIRASAVVIEHDGRRVVLTLVNQAVKKAITQ